MHQLDLSQDNGFHTQKGQVFGVPGADVCDLVDRVMAEALLGILPCRGLPPDTHAHWLVNNITAACRQTQQRQQHQAVSALPQLTG
jgi:hypothetical protein